MESVEGVWNPGQLHLGRTVLWPARRSVTAQRMNECSSEAPEGKRSPWKQLRRKDQRGRTERMKAAWRRASAGGRS